MKVPNPNGKRGRLKHQSAVAKEAVAQDGPGKEVRTEYLVITPNGRKSRRFVDIAVLSEGMESLFV